MIWSCDAKHCQLISLKAFNSLPVYYFLGATDWTIVNSIKVTIYYLIIRILTHLSLVQSVAPRQIRGEIICLCANLLALWSCMYANGRWKTRQMFSFIDVPEPSTTTSTLGTKAYTVKTGSGKPCNCERHRHMCITDNTRTQWNHVVIILLLANISSLWYWALIIGKISLYGKSLDVNPWIRALPQVSTFLLAKV